jgi:hypothetical protein
MTENAVKRKLFILEGEVGFCELSVCEKIIEVMKLSSVEVQEWFDQLGSDGSKLPEWNLL